MRIWIEVRILMYWWLTYHNNTWIKKNVENFIAMSNRVYIYIYIYIYIYMIKYFNEFYPACFLFCTSHVYLQKFNCIQNKSQTKKVKNILQYTSKGERSLHTKKFCLYILHFQTTCILQQKLIFSIWCCVFLCRWGVSQKYNWQVCAHKCAFFPLWLILQTKHKIMCHVSW